ncbi:hypothetical protein EYB31_03525 [Paenibacillus thalictri]|uniref:NADP-dependent oxidoreductase domain-containing protein n=2 Tax=Paenibacillus thalictri TaxID=2527873 RepID=A0A4Q9DWE7_9BACL|nr:hypothetical protein EYB31_03525 [Paenibacillus thalictri]
MEEQEVNPVRTAVKWVTQQPGITPAIIGASRPKQLDASLQAADMNTFTEQQLIWLDGLVLTATPLRI